VSPRLAPVPDTPPRAVIYTRQSVARDDSVSLQLQETACRDHCDRHGYEVVAVLADPGISGRTWRRPGVVRTLAMVEDGTADVVVLWRWSRLSRSRRDWALAIDRVDAAGGRIESATEPVDTSTASGRLARGMLTEIAAWDSEVKGEQWREAHARRLDAGLPHTGKARFGYVYDRAAKLHRPDPVTGPFLAEAYRRYVAGESVYALVRWLNAEGVPTVTGCPWRDRALRRVLDAGFAAGRITYGERVVEGVHERLVDADTWAAYLAARRARRARPARTERSEYLLSGLLRCARCGASMAAGQFGEHRQPKYRCSAGKETGVHAGGYVLAAFVERAVLDWLAGLAGDVEAAAAAHAATAAAATASRADTARLARDVAALDAQLVALTRQLAAGLVPDAAYAAARDEILAARADAAGRLEAAEDRARAVAARPGAAARDLLADWDLLPVAVRREALRALIARVEVTCGRPRAAVRVVPAWER